METWVIELIQMVGVPFAAFYLMLRYIGKRDSHDAVKEAVQGKTETRLLDIHSNTNAIIKQNTEKIDRFSNAVLQQFQTSESTTRALADAQSKLADALTRMTGALETQGTETRAKLAGVAATVQQSVQSVQTIVADGAKIMDETNRENAKKLDEILSKLDRIEKRIDTMQTQETQAVTGDDQPPETPVTSDETKDKTEKGKDDGTPEQ